MLSSWNVMLWNVMLSSWNVMLSGVEASLPYR